MSNYSEYYNECLKYYIDEDFILSPEEYCSYFAFYNLIYDDWYKEIINE